MNNKINVQLNINLLTRDRCGSWQSTANQASNKGHEAYKAYNSSPLFVYTSELSMGDVIIKSPTRLLRAVEEQRLLSVYVLLPLGRFPRVATPRQSAHKKI